MINNRFLPTIKNKTSFAPVAVVLLGALILCYWAFHNLFPLVYSDTGTYISSGFTGKVPGDRPIVYGLFIRHMSMATSLWFVVFVQGIIVSYLLYCFVSVFYTGKHKYIVFSSLICFLTFTTAISSKTSTLMPDIFAATGCLALILLLVKNELNNYHKAAIAILWVLSNLVHYTHTYISLFTLLLISALLLFKKIERSFIQGRSLLIAFSLVGVSLILSPAISRIYGGGFVNSKYAHIFMTERLIQNGVLISYLEEHCNDNNYKLCALRDSLELRDFMWSPDSPIYKIGGWEHCDTELKPLLSDIFHSPKYLLMFGYKTIESSFKEFFSFDTNVEYDNPSMGINSPPDFPIKKYFRHQRQEFTESFQSINKLDYTDLNKRQNIVVWASFICVLLYAFKFKSRYSKQWIVILLCLFYLYLNAVICGGLSIPNPRYQSRVIWLLPLLFFVFIIENRFVQKLVRVILKEANDANKKIINSNSGL